MLSILGYLYFGDMIQFIYKCIYLILHSSHSFNIYIMHSTCKCHSCPILCKLKFSCNRQAHVILENASAFIWGATYYIKARWENQDCTLRIFCKFCVMDGIGARIPTHGALNNKEPTIYRYKDVKIYHWEPNLSSSSAAMLERTNRMSTDPWRQI